MDRGKLNVCLVGNEGSRTADDGQTPERWPTPRSVASAVMSNPPPSYPRISPYLLYEDAASAVEYLQRSFGFQLRSVVLAVRTTNCCSVSTALSCSARPAKASRARGQSESFLRR